MKNFFFKKAIYSKIDKRFKIVKDSLEKDLKRDHLRIKVLYVGICGSDLHNYFKKPLRGKFNEWLSLSYSDGHEALGEVIEVGKNIHNFINGNKVVIEAVNHCSICNMCMSGDYHLCISRKDLPWLGNGAFSEIIEVPAKVCYQVPKTKNLDVYTLSEPLSSAIHAYNKVNLVAGSKVLIIGSGTIGLLLGILLNNNKNIETTIGYKNQLQLKIIKDLKINSLKTIDKNYDYQSKFDYVFETSGNHKIIEDCIYYSKKGSTIVIIGASNSKSNFTYGQLLNKEIKILSSLCYGWKNNIREFETAINFIYKNKKKLKKIITHVFSLKDINKAFDTAIKSNSIKILLKP